MLFIILNNFFVIVVVAMVRGKVMSNKAATSKDEKLIKEQKIMNGGSIFDQVGTRSKVVLPDVVGALYDTPPKASKKRELLISTVDEVPMKEGVCDEKSGTVD